MSIGEGPSYSHSRSRRAGLPNPCAPFRPSLALDTRERCFTWRRALTRQRRWWRRGNDATATGNPHPVVRRRGRAVAIELILAGRLNRGLSQGERRGGRHGGFYRGSRWHPHPVIGRGGRAASVEPVLSALIRHALSRGDRGGRDDPGFRGASPEETGHEGQGHDPARADPPSKMSHG